MKRLAKYLCITAVAMTLLTAGAGWTVNRWLQSASGHALIEARLSKALRMPVKIDKLTFSVWSGVSAAGVSVAAGAGTAFEAAAIFAGHRLSSLLRGNLEFGEVRIERPRLRLVAEDSGGRPLLPSVPAAPATIATAPSAAPAPAISSAPEEKPHFAIARVVLTGGAVEMLDQQLAPSASVTNLALTLTGATERGFTASFEAARVAFRSGTALNQVSGAVQLSGLGDRNALAGSGTLTIQSGTCREIELLRQIGELLQLRSVADFEIADATARFRIANQLITISPMNVSAPPLGLALTGTSTFDGTLDLSAILHAPADLINQRGMLASQFSPPDQNNRRGVQFNITGPLKKPKHNLAERVTGTKDRRAQRIIAAEAIITALTGKKKPAPAPPPPVPAQP